MQLSLDTIFLFWCGFFISATLITLLYILRLTSIPLSLFIFHCAAPTQVPSQTQRTRTPTPPTTPFYKNSPNPAKNFTNSPNSNPRCRCSGVQPCGKKCGWHHSSNALWRELENSPFNKRKNKEVA